MELWLKKENSFAGRSRAHIAFFTRPGILHGSRTTGRANSSRAQNSMRAGKPFRDAARVEEKLDRARIVRSKDIPRDVITLNSVVRIRYVDTGEEHTFTLVLPGDKGETNRVSILAPTGIALLGYREKDLVEWQVPAGKRRVQIMKVVYQPERHADYNA